MLWQKVLSHFFGAFSKPLNYKQLKKSNTKLESRFCFAVTGPHPIQINTPTNTAKHPLSPGSPVVRGPCQSRPTLSITYFGDFCILFTSLNKINVVREAASKLETFLTLKWTEIFSPKTFAMHHNVEKIMFFRFNMEKLIGTNSSSRDSLWVLVESWGTQNYSMGNKAFTIFRNVP